MKSNTMTKIGVLTLLATALLGAASYGLYWLGMERGMGMTAAPAITGNASAATTTTTTTATTAAVVTSNESGEDATLRHITSGIKSGDIDPANGRKVLYYHDPMMPANKFDKPAKSPFMDMMMSPVYADADGDESKVTVSPRVQQNLGLRTAAVTQGRLSPQIFAVGNIAFNERDQVLVQARATGYVERLHVRATLDRVSKGQALADIYVPDWIAAQEEFLSIRRLQGSSLRAQSALNGRTPARSPRPWADWLAASVVWL